MPSINARVEVDQRTGTKLVLFNSAVSAMEASTFLFGNASKSALLKPQGALYAGKTDRYILDTRDVATIMQLKPDILRALTQSSLTGNTGAPLSLPSWVPDQAKQDILSGRLHATISRYRGQPSWGDVVVWKGSSAIELYQEFPADLAYYTAIAISPKQAHLLHFAYTQYNKDMKHFVELRQLSPEQARSEIRRINDEVFRLIVEGAASILASGATITQVSAMIRQNADQIASAAERSSRFRLANTGTKVRPVNGKVNVGGGLETPNMTNLNPCKPGGGPTSGIPNHIRGGMEEMDELFLPGSVDYMMSSKLPYVAVNWSQAVPAAAKSMRSGGKVEMNVWCTASEAQILRAHFERAGFREVKVTGDSVGTMLTAIKK